MSSKTPPFTRRAALALAAGTLAAAALGPVASAQRRQSGPEEIPIDQLMASGTLPEIVIGKADAPVTIVEYASMTCGHCGNFHNNVLPKIKEKYIDTGKARLVLREFPLDNLGAAAAMLARCAGGDKAAGLIEVLFEQQQTWAFSRTPLPELQKIAKQAGFTEESFNKCLSDQKLLDQIVAVRERASRDFGVNSTPTFFINGKRLRGGGLEDFDKAIEPLLKK